MADSFEHVSHHALSDVGVRRSHNQDAFTVAIAPGQEAFHERGHLFVVADGMGAHAVGEMASKLAVDTISHLYHKRKDLPPAAALRQAIRDANETIHEKGKLNPEFAGMGTTATALLLMPDGARVGHVGDSRCYRLRGSRIEQLSFDHSLHWEMARRNRVRPEEMTGVPTNIIIRSLGPTPKVKVDVGGPYDVQAGDRYLLCSDGLSGQVSDAEIWATIASMPGPEACQFLVDLANSRGGIDNITLVLVEIHEPKRKDHAGPISRGAQIRAWAWSLARRVPLAWWFVIAGFLFSSIAYTLRALARGVVIPLTVLGIGCWIVGLALLVFRRKREEKQKSVAPPPPPPVHRSVVVELTAELVASFATATQEMAELAKVEAWPIDARDLARLQSQAEQARGEGRFADAIAVFGQVMSLLSRGQQQVRDKHEVFRPNFQG